MGIADFTQLADSVSETFVTDESHMINVVQDRCYTAGYLVGGKTPEEVFRATPTLRDTLYLTKKDMGRRYDPADLKMDFSNPQLGTQVSAEWSFYVNHMAWSKMEVELNAPSSAGKKYTKARFKELLNTKRQNLMQSMVDQMESEIWAPAEDTLMGTDYLAPMSIPYFITEESGGVPLDGTTGSALSSGDVMGLDVASYSNWDNERLTYGDASGNTAGGGDLIGQLVLMGIKLHYKALPKEPQHGERESRPNVVLCSDKGINYILAANREGQDMWTAREYGAGALILNGVVYENIPALNTAALYTDGSSGMVAEDSASATNRGPRYYFISKDALRPFFFKDNYFSADPAANLTAVGRPNDWVKVFHTWNQLWCQDRRKLGIVSPSGTL